MTTALKQAKLIDLDCEEHQRGTMCVAIYDIIALHIYACILTRLPHNIHNTISVVNAVEFSQQFL